MQLPCAGGGKGRPRPLHPRQGVRPASRCPIFAELLAYAARGRGPAPDTPARGVRPLDPRFDA